MMSRVSEPDIEVRVAGPSDRAALEALIEACYGSVYPRWYATAVLAEALPRMLAIDGGLLESGRYYKALIDGRAAGCGGWSTAVPGGGQELAGTGHVRHFATHPAFLRRGVGSAILARCVADARACGVTVLRCFSSLPAEAFYAHHGFVRLREMTVAMGAVELPTVLMQREMGGSVLPEPR